MKGECYNRYHRNIRNHQELLQTFIRLKIGKSKRNNFWTHTFHQNWALKTKNLNRPVILIEIESVMQTPYQRKAQDRMVSLLYSTRFLKKKLMQILLELFKATEREANLPNSFYGANITLISQTEKENNKENFRSISVIY